MTPQELLTLYAADSYVKLLGNQIDTPVDNRVQVKGLVGSLDAVLAATLRRQPAPRLSVYVLSDRDEAGYFQNDLQSLLGTEDVLFYPTSYKRPYQYEETDNASVLMRAEILNKLTVAKVPPLQIVTYPEALFEKVINKRSLIANTFSVKVGEKLDPTFITEFLNDYGFEMTDFVFEAGQFSLRGGIVDVYSYASEYPFRIELFGDEVESLRSFDPETQLSVETVRQINIVPDIQQKLETESRESFLSFLPETAALWFKDVELTLEIIEKSFVKAEEALQEVTGGGIQIVSNPETLFETRRGFLNKIKTFKTVEFGRRFYFKNEDKILYSARPQPSFNKDFNRLIEDLSENQEAGFVNLIAAEQPKQLDRLERVFADIDPYTKFRPLNIALREGFVDEHLKLTLYTDHQIFAQLPQVQAKSQVQ